MKKRFIVALDSTTAEQNAAFGQFIKDSGQIWWHWLSNVWLIIDESGELEASGLRDQIRVFYPTINHLVIELRADGDTWAGFGPKAETKNMFTWLKANWKR